MQRLNRGMLCRYEIPEHIPSAVRAVQFGLGEVLLGVVDRLLDAACPELGIACVPTGTPWQGEGKDPAALLREQDCLYTLLVRGYRDETPVKREIVVQSIICVAEGPDDPARDPALVLGLLDTEGPRADLQNAAKLLSARCAAGLDGLWMICLGEDAHCADRVRDAIAALNPDPGFARWLTDACAFCPALADGLAFRADAKEAARQCAEMNYADGMLHLAEPYARLTIQAPSGLREVLSPDDHESIALVDDLAPALEGKRRAFDAGLFTMAAPGWLLGCNTLSECMKHERLREYVGRTYNDELLPSDPAERAALAPLVIQAFERFENPLTDNALLPSAKPLLARLGGGKLRAAPAAELCLGGHDHAVRRGASQRRRALRGLPGHPGPRAGGRPRRAGGVRHPVPRHAPRGSGLRRPGRPGAVARRGPASDRRPGGPGGAGHRQSAAQAGLPAGVI